MQNDLSDRLEKVEVSLDNMREQQYKYHLELLERLQGFHNHCNDEINEVRRTIERHGNYWAMLISTLGLMGAGVVAYIQGLFPRH